MLLVIKVLGSLLLMIGLAAIVFPAIAKKKLHFFFEDQWLNMVSGLRIIIGFFLITAAPMSMHPTLLLVAGMAVIGMGFGVLLLTHKQIIQTEIWWLERDQNQIRMLSLLPIGIGSLLYFAGS